jgi:prepilin-type N-terminal cleavage/methylation domain-containing protein
MTRHRATRDRGFSLVEVIVFIVVAGVLTAALTVALVTLLRDAPKAGQLDRATELAQQRMELILGQRRAAGFAAFADPCPGPSICTPAAGYAVSSSIVTGWGADPANYKVVTVVVTGPSSLTATALVANY